MVRDPAPPGEAGPGYRVIGDPLGTNGGLRPEVWALPSRIHLYNRRPETDRPWVDPGTRNNFV